MTKVSFDVLLFANHAAKRASGERERSSNSRHGKGKLHKAFKSDQQQLLIKETGSTYKPKKFRVKAVSSATPQPPTPAPQPTPSPATATPGSISFAVPTSRPSSSWFYTPATRAPSAPQVSKFDLLIFLGDFVFRSGQAFLRLHRYCKEKVSLLQQARHPHMRRQSLEDSISRFALFTVVCLY